ncbi:MAG TPA: hypothetical protein VFK57_02345 [Vicinamibacterales bacterium]|nr:hypothetical protein [Vicinamibacterales bacterium]
MEAAPRTIARAREILLVCAAGFVLALLMTWPLATDPGGLGRTHPNDADGQFAIWNVSWVARTLVADPLRLFDANIYHPHRLTLAYSEANILTGAIGLPVYWLTSNPWLTLNAVMIAGFASAYAAAYFLMRHLTGSRPASAAAAVLYAYCPYVMSHLSHIQLLMTGGIPLALLLLHRVADDVTSPKLVRRGAALGVALAAQALTCAYYGIFAGLAVGYAALVLAWSRRLWTARRYWIAVAAGAATSIALVLPFFIPFLEVQEESGFARSLEDTARWAARPHGYLVSSANAHRWLLDLVRRFGPWDEVLFPGILALVLGAAGIVLALRRAGRDRETALLYGSLGALAFWASFGPDAGLYRVLYHLPAFSFLRAPSRLGLVVVLCLALFAAFALREIFARLPARGRGIAAAAALAAAVADLAIVPLIWYRAPQLPAGYAVLAKSPRGPLAEFPFYGERIAFPLHAQYMLFSTSHWMPMVNGYSDVIPNDFRQAAVVLDGFPSDDAFRVLARRRVRYIAVHWDMFAGRQAEIRARLEPYLRNLRTLSADDRMTLFEVVRYP